LRDESTLAAHAERWDVELRAALAAFGERRRRQTPLHRDKAYLQLLTFTASSLAILGTLRANPLEAEFSAITPGDAGVLESELVAAGSLEGRARSGNHAMFLAIALLHAREFLGRDVDSRLDKWVALHRARMNRFGFWGPGDSMSHLQFQNGYHQYEVFEYLDTPGIPWDTAARSVASLADELGQFAPYPGGGGCYDYDAVFVLSADVARHRELLDATTSTIRAAQNADGGFGESRFVRPRSFANLTRTARHIVAARGRARLERLRMGLTLQRPKHDRIHTHWSEYSREWGESDLWDSWFRMLALARRDVALSPGHAATWGFIDYPGIGFHHCLRAGAH
jgi:hypothetical protein